MRFFVIIFVLINIFLKTYSLDNNLLIDFNFIYLNNKIYEKILFGYENFINNNQFININIGINNIHTNFGINLEFNGKYTIDTNKINNLYFYSGVGITIHYLKNNIYNERNNRVNIPDSVLPYFIMGTGYRFFLDNYIKNLFFDIKSEFHLNINLINNLDYDFTIGLILGYTYKN